MHKPRFCLVGEAPEANLAAALQVQTGLPAVILKWLRGLDLNQRPSGYEAEGPHYKMSGRHKRPI
jgi:hypothetical protein